MVFLQGFLPKYAIFCLVSFYLLIFFFLFFRDGLLGTNKYLLLHRREDGEEEKAQRISEAKVLRKPLELHVDR